MSEKNTELMAYFNHDFIENFDIFLPINIPRDVTQFDEYVQNEIGVISEYFKLNTNIIKKQWSDFRKIGKDVWCQFEDQEPHVFYQNYLRLNLQNYTKKILEIMMTLPMCNKFLFNQSN